MLECNYITLNDITHVLAFSQTLPADFFKEPTEKLLSHFPSEGKLLVNFFYGSLGKRTTRRNFGAVTDSFNIAAGTVIAYKQQKVKVASVSSDLWFLRHTVETTNRHGHLPIYRHITAAGIMQLELLHRTISIPNTIVVAYNTDCIKLIGFDSTNVFSEKDKRNAKPGDFVEEKVRAIQGRFVQDLKSAPVFTEELPLENKNENLVTSTDNVVVTGMPGTGKTYLLKELYDKDPKTTLVLTYTNRSKENLVKRGVPAQTFDHHFPTKENQATWTAKVQKYKRIMVDEFTMPPKRFYHLLYCIRCAYPEMVFQLFGDPNQCHATETDMW